MPELRMEEIQAGYFLHLPILHGVTLVARPKEVTVVLGPNGSGKSTSLRVIVGMLQPTHGAVILDARDITSYPAEDRIALGIGFLPQGRSTFPDLSVHENLELGAWSLRKDRAAFAKAIESTYDRYPVLAKYSRRPAGSLSGGQQRILEFGRMMVTDPQVVLIDEPSVGLAPVLADQVYDEIWKLRDEARTILMVDQNVRAAVELADHVYTLEYGRNALEGGRDEFEDKLHDLIRDWLRL